MSVVEIFEKFPKSEDYLIEILLEIQNQNEQNYLPMEDLKKVAKHLDITEGRISSVVSFYTFFHLEPRGKYIIQVCKDVPCYLVDGFNLLQSLKDLLFVELGETTDDNLFTLELSSCLGCCEQGPVMRINQKTYTNLTLDKVKIILAELRGTN